MIASAYTYVLIGCVWFGLGLGNVTSLPPLIAQAEFRRTDVPRVVALVTSVSQAGYAFAPTIFALIVTATGPTGLFATAAVVQLAAAATLCSIGRNVPAHTLQSETTS